MQKVSLTYRLRHDRTVLFAITAYISGIEHRQVSCEVMNIIHNTESVNMMSNFDLKLFPLIHNASCKNVIENQVLILCETIYHTKFVIFTTVKKEILLSAGVYKLVRGPFCPPIHGKKWR